MPNVGDALITSASLLSWNQDLGMLSSGAYSASPSTFSSAVTDNMFGANNQNQQNIVNAVMLDIEKYLVGTNQAIVLNDITNTNDYVYDTVNNEKTRTDTLKKKTGSMINRTRQSFLQKRYRIEYNRFVTSMLMFMTLTVLVVACMFGLMKQDHVNLLVAAGVSSIAVFFFLIAVLVYIKNNQTRRKDDWSKYYFPSMGGSKNSGSC
jgi:lipopolysaccharide export LptBFGC system permease protein LptF